MSWKQDFQEFQVFQKFQEIPRLPCFHILWKQGFRESMGQLTAAVACMMISYGYQIKGRILRKDFLIFKLSYLYSGGITGGLLVIGSICNL